jgi:hypothetical protein
MIMRNKLAEKEKNVVDSFNPYTALAWLSMRWYCLRYKMKVTKSFSMLENKGV